MENPLQGTVLYSLEIPRAGGDTHFSNQHKSFEAMPDDMRERFDDLQAIHSPALGYSLDGAYGDKEKMGSMDSHSLALKRSDRRNQGRSYGEASAGLSRY